MDILIDKKKALQNWSSVLDYLNVQDETKRQWMAEYAEMHRLNENVAYSTLGNLYGMGAVTPPQIGGDGVWGATHTYAGDGAPLTTGKIGSGDLAQSLLPVAMKVAAKAIGLDLVAVKPVTSVRVELVYLDFKYDNNPQGHDDSNYDEHPLVFKLRVNSTDQEQSQTYLNNILKSGITFLGVNEIIGGLDKRVWVGIKKGSDFNKSGMTTDFSTIYTQNAVTKKGILEFLGFSRIDGLPMFRTYRQNNNAAAGGWVYDQAKNTFEQDKPIKDQLEGCELTFQVGAGNNDVPIDGGIVLTGATIELVSTLEDHIPGFSANWYNNRPMSRLEDENTYPGVISPDVFTKSVAIGTIDISCTLKRTQLEDIKSSTGMDIIQKLESVLINELTQTISKQIVDKIKTLAAENRASHTVPKDANGNSIFDFDVDAYLSGSGSQAPGGETYHSIQRKLIAKINNASNFILVDGRIGTAQYLVTNGKLASVLQDVAGYTISPVANSKLNNNGDLYPVGNIGNIAIYVDPYMRWDDMRIFLGRKNTPEQPGIIFLPYLMAETIKLISEATWSPRMLIRSRYAITDVGFFPWKQYMEIRVKDSNGVLI